MDEQFIDDLDMIDNFDNYDFEDFDESAASRRKSRLRARAKAILRSRRNANNKQKLNGRPQGTKVTDVVKQTKSAVQDLNIENKVQADETEKRFNSQSSRISRAETTLVVSKIVDELKNLLPGAEKNPLLRYALPIAPLFFLKPNKKGEGVSGFISDPRVWGAAAVAGLAVLSDYRQSEKNKDETPAELVFDLRTVTLTSSLPQHCIATTIKSSTGKVITNGPKIVWRSSNESIVLVDSYGLVSLPSNPISGNAFVSGSLEGTTIEARLQVYVQEDSPGDIVITPTSTNVAVNTTVAVSGTILDRDNRKLIRPIGPKIIWTSSNSAVAKVDEKGNVTGVANGNAQITGRIEGTNISRNFQITVP